MSMESRGSPWAFCFSLHCPPPYTSRQCLSLEPRAYWFSLSNRTACSRGLLSLPPLSLDWIMWVHIWHLCGYWRSKLDLMLLQQARYPSSHRLSPVYFQTSTLSLMYRTDYFHGRPEAQGVSLSSSFHVFFSVFSQPSWSSPTHRSSTIMPTCPVVSLTLLYSLKNSHGCR